MSWAARYLAWLSRAFLWAVTHAVAQYLKDSRSNGTSPAKLLEHHSHKLRTEEKKQSSDATADRNNHNPVTLQGIQQAV